MPVFSTAGHEAMLVANKLAGLLEEDDSPEATTHVWSKHKSQTSLSIPSYCGTVPIPTRVAWRSRLAASTGYAPWGRILQVLTRRFGAQGPLALSVSNCSLHPRLLLGLLVRARQTLGRRPGAKKSNFSGIRQKKAWGFPAIASGLGVPASSICQGKRGSARTVM